MKVSQIPYTKLQIGDRVIGPTGLHGVIAFKGYLRGNDEAVAICLFADRGPTGPELWWHHLLDNFEYLQP